jgi:hypothetical protein
LNRAVARRTSSRAGARVHHPPPPPAAWENGGSTVLQVGRPRRVQANGPASAGWWKRPNLATGPHPKHLLSTFSLLLSRPPAAGERFHSPGLPRPRLPGVPDPKWSRKPVGLRLTAPHLTPRDCHTRRASDNPKSPARQRPHAERRPVREAGSTTHRRLPPHGKTVEAPYSRLRPHHWFAPTSAPAPAQKPLLSSFSCLLSRPQANGTRPWGQPPGWPRRTGPTLCGSTRRSIHATFGQLLTLVEEEHQPPPSREPFTEGCRTRGRWLHSHSSCGYGPDLEHGKGVRTRLWGFSFLGTARARHPVCLWPASRVALSGCTSGAAGEAGVAWKVQAKPYRLPALLMGGHPG